MNTSIHAPAVRASAALLLAAAAALPGVAWAQAITEGFDDVTTLAGKGWVMQNNSNPVGLMPNWYQGLVDVTTFPARSGAANAYIAANSANTTGNNTISNWLLMPNRTLRNGDVLTFYTRKPTIGSGQTDYPDRLQIRLSTNGASTNVGSGATALGDFTTLLLDINPALQAGVYPQTWTQYTITVAGLPAPTSGRIAYRYFVTNGGPDGTNSDYIGLDDVAYTPYVCPTLTVSGTPGSGAAGEAYGGATLSQTGALGAPSFAITAGALPPGLALSSGGAISGTPTATGTFNFGVTASDNSGCASAQKPLSITVLAGKPPQPASVTATAGNTTAQVSWTPVWTDPYGVAVDSYTATAVEAPTKSCTANDGAASSCTVTGLTNGTSYTFRVVAKNGSAGQFSDPAVTNAVTPRGAPTLGLSASPASPSTWGQGVTFTATLAGASSPTGAVTFKDGAAVLCTAPAAPYTCAAPALAVGAHAITASYAGDAANHSASGSLNHTVNKAAQAITGFATTPASVVYAQGGQFTVQATGGGSGNPVTFTSQSPAVCTVAQNTVTMLAGGTCTIAADQAGNANYDAAPQLQTPVTIAAPVDGACGAAAGQAQATAPAANLCSAGTPGAASSASGQYTWQCQGENGGTPASCQAPWANAGGGKGSVSAPTNGWQVNSASFSATPPAAAPQGTSFPAGVLALNLDSGAPGSDATVTLHFTSPVPQGAVYMKYGPTPDGYNGCRGNACTQPHWYQLPAQKAVLAPDGLSATLTLTDNGLGDSDTVGGTITDPGGFALLGAPVPADTRAIPTLGEWALALLAGVLGLFSLGALRRRGC